MVCCREDAILWPSRVIETMEMAALVPWWINRTSRYHLFRPHFDRMHSDRRPKCGDDVDVASLRFSLSSFLSLFSLLRS